MNLDLRYPFLTSGIPRRNTRRRDLYMAISMSVDVPEVAQGETDVVFRSYQACRLERRSQIYSVGGSNPDYEVAMRGGGVDLRTFRGGLYRRIGKVREILEDARHSFKLGRAFPHVIGDTKLEYGANISFAATGTSNPLSAALVRQWDWELERNSVSDSRVVNAWPNTMSGTTRHATREQCDFRELAPEIDEIDSATSERSLRMIRHQAERLLSIGGEIWMACRPPCFMVEVDETREFNVTLSLAHANDGIDPVLSRRYFALGDLEAAREYVRQCARKTGRERAGYQCYEALPEFDVIDPDVMEYDADGEEISRIGYALASECSRYLARNAEFRGPLPAAKQEVLDSAMRAVEATNYVTGEFGDVAPHVEDLCDMWHDLVRPSTFFEIGPAPARKRFGDMMIKRASKLLESAPISLGTAPLFSLGHPGGL